MFYLLTYRFGRLVQALANILPTDFLTGVEQS
jgi:hypothetical protein